MNCFRKRKTDPKSPPSRRMRFILLLFAIIQNGLLGGIMYGWASIDSTMLIAPISKGGAGIEPEKTTLVFSWATSIGMVSSFFLGIILDTFGPRTSSVVSCLIIAIGSHMLAES
ncbi:hypothetical protein FRACYDRAFT_267672, partial [Fragilariopsis cylindrus CCMP1102]